jgi:hypothetical protein
MNGIENHLHRLKDGLKYSSLGEVTAFR